MAYRTLYPAVLGSLGSAGSFCIPGAENNVSKVLIYGGLADFGTPGAVVVTECGVSRDTHKMKSRGKDAMTHKFVGGVQNES
jgi:hypothetical protein